MTESNYTEPFNPQETEGIVREPRIYYLTFGQKSPARNGWVEIIAENFERAKEIADSKYGQNGYSMIRKDIKPEFFPSGRLDRIR